MTDHSSSPDHRPGFWEPNANTSARREHDAREPDQHSSGFWSSTTAFMLIIVVFLLLALAQSMRGGLNMTCC